MTNPFAMSTIAKHTSAYGQKIYMAGDYGQAKQILREYCSENGACFSIHKTDYIYSGGEEEGFCVTLINYPRLHKDSRDIRKEAEIIGNKLMQGLNQSSYTIEGYGTEIDHACEGIDRVVTPLVSYYSRKKG